jgi:hypothetical protein
MLEYLTGLVGEGSKILYTQEIKLGQEIDGSKNADPMTAVVLTLGHPDVIQYKVVWCKVIQVLVIQYKVV